MERKEREVGIVWIARNDIGKKCVGIPIRCRVGGLWKSTSSGCVGCVEIQSTRVKVNLLLPVQYPGEEICRPPPFS